ncbi:MAG: beta-lactamase family protein [Lachnospiraceae bacterium]|nr:beta-lactamase family protein [Lachnospiraceae bacterium]
MDFDKIKEYLNSVVESGVPSVDCIIMQDHKQVFRYMTGCTDHERTKEVKEDQLYLMFSMTKVQTMTAVMQLVEQGKISLEDEIGNYLPAYKNIMVKSADGEVKPAATSLKLKHLVSMQSGLDYDLSRPGILRVLREKGAKAGTQELVNSFVESPLKFNPGTHFEYSLSHDVVAAVIEVVSGISFGEYLKKNIWEPVGMNSTYFAKPMNYDKNLAEQYEYDGEKNLIKPMEPSCCYQLSESYESGGAGLISCTEDYAKLGDTLANGGVAANGNRILKAETIEIIRTNLLEGDSLDEIVKNMGRLGYGYGCGMQILMKPELIGSPAPAGIFGWDGAAGSCVIMCPEQKKALAFSMHVRGYGPAYGVIHPMLRDLVFGEE